MESNDDSKSNSKNNKRWNFFQRGLLGKAGGSSSTQLDPVELQRVSFATSIDDLPDRPSAFQQVLSQIKTDKLSTPRSVFRMTRLQNLRKMSKDNRSTSPQRGTVSGTSSSPTPRVLDSLLHVQTRPRSSSNTSTSANIADISFTSEPKELDLIATSTANESQMSSDSPSKNSVPATLGSVSSSTPAGLLLIDSAPLTTSSVPELSAVPQLDVADGFLFSEYQKNKQMTENIRQKIFKISEALKAEQATRDENVTEYLRLTKDADKAQVTRVKPVFEKKDQKSKASIAQLQKKLDTYHKKLKELDGGSGKAGILRDVGANLRDFSGGVVDSFKHATQNAAGVIVNKPKVMATKLKNRFGSADNLSSLKDDYDVNTEDRSYPESGDDVSSTSGSIDNIHSLGSDIFPPEDYFSRRIENPKKQDKNADITRDLLSISTQLRDIKNDLEKVRLTQIDLEQELKNTKNDMQLFVTNQLNQEKRRHEEQLTDVNEFHRREISTIRQEMERLEGKIEYHARERTIEIQDAVGRCQTRISKMELQQQQHSMSVEGLENATARALMGKLINLLLSVMAVLLVLVSTVSGIIMPFIKSQGRVFFTVLVTVVSVIVYRNWDTIFSWYQLIAS